MALTIGCVGCGNMGGAIMAGLARTGGYSLCGYNRTAARMRPLEELGVSVLQSPLAVAQAADVLVLGVKPYQAAEVLEQMRPGLTAEKTVVSVAAGVSCQRLSQAVDGRCPVVRCMPNTPALLGAGVTGLYAAPQVDAAGRQRAEQLLASAGATVWVAGESLVDAVTAVSGSGPAYAFLLAEAMEAAAVAEGLPAADARSLVVHTLLGAGRMLAESGQAPAELRRQVTSPGGTTQAAIETFQAGGLETLVARAVHAARQRAAELATGAGA